MKVRILGCGTSSGVPRIGNDWGDCDPAEPRNRRTRGAILVESDAGSRVLVDTGPDFREQMLAAGVSTFDAVIWTHDHADHVNGIDDLRQVFHAMRRPVRGLARPHTLAVLRERFGYVFDGRGGYPPTVAVEALPDRLTIGDIAVTVTDQPHGDITSAGLRFEADGASLAYATDFSHLTSDMRSLYHGVDLWIVDALRRRPHPTHPTVDDVAGWHAELGPKQTMLVHMDQSMDYATLTAELPAGIAPAHDGWEARL